MIKFRDLSLNSKNNFIKLCIKNLPKNIYLSNEINDLLISRYLPNLNTIRIYGYLSRNYGYFSSKEKIKLTHINALSVD